MATASLYVFICFFLISSLLYTIEHPALLKEQDEVDTFNRNIYFILHLAGYSLK